MCIRDSFGADGLPSDIPVTLSEYRFDNEKDIKDYLSLVNQIPELFTQVLDFEEDVYKRQQKIHLQ